ELKGKYVPRTTLAGATAEGAAAPAPLPTRSSAPPLREPKADEPEPKLAPGTTGGPPPPESLVALASKIRGAGRHPAARNNRVIAVGVDAQGKLVAGSSNGFDRGQRAAAEALGIECVPSKKACHAEENLMREVSTLQKVGTSRR